MYILKNTNPKSKFFGQLCVSYDRFGTTYVFYRNRKTVWTNVNGFLVYREYKHDDIVIYKGKQYKFNSFGGGTVNLYHLNQGIIGGARLLPYEFLNRCVNWGATLV